MPIDPGGEMVTDIRGSLNAGRNPVKFCRVWSVAGALLFALGSFTGTVYAQPMPSVMAIPIPVSVPTCKPHQLDHIVGTDDVATHRRFALPVLDYPSNAVADNWGIPFRLLVDTTGHVACQVMEEGEFGHAQTLNVARRALLHAMSAWRYLPFDVDGKPSAVAIDEFVVEQRLPRKHLPLPGVPFDQVTISLWRTGCFGTCPTYGVRIHGDGTVRYEGSGWVDVLGKHDYHIPVEQVAQLVEDLRHNDLWSMDTSYRAPITDNPTYVLTLDMGGAKHEIEDYVGHMVGMPKVISDFEDEVDRVGRTSEWTHLSLMTVEHLQQEGFDFRSQRAADMLARSVTNDEGHDQSAMMRMIELGTPVLGGNSVRPPPGPAVRTDQTLLNDVLLHHRVALVDPLLARGLLETHGKLDTKKLKNAFHDAIRGGRLEAVQKIWHVAGDEAHPSLWFDDQDDDGAGKATHRTVPVSLLLSRPYRDTHWQGLQIAEWLAGKGCDLKAHAANGATLLHRAVDASDVTFVRYLLAQGLPVSAPGEYGLPALGSASDEDIALLLLDAGSNWKMDDGGVGFKRYATQQHWVRVLAWLEQHDRS